MPGYNKNIALEEKVHEAVTSFARELHELMGSPEIKVDPDRYSSRMARQEEGE